MQKYPDKINLSRDMNIRYARQNFTNLIHTNARFEGINTTLPQTQTIIDGLGVSGVSVDDINTIVDLKHGWQYITETDNKFDLNVAKHINKLVAARDSLDPGEFRTGTGGVDIGESDMFTPEPVNIDREKEYLGKVLNSDSSHTDKALTIMFHNMRSQMFWDGNKRTSTIFANKYMIDHGVGLINVPLNHWAEFNEKLTKFYKTNDMADIKDWAYNVAIQTPQLGLDRSSELTKRFLNQNGLER